jgi:hypothetical protein
MSISQYNYEAYFLDYHEGRLDAEATKELMGFLALHPELIHEFESFEAVSLNDIEEIRFENKESLKRSVSPVNTSNFDEIAVQHIEGTLNTTLTNELLTFIELHAEYQKDLDIYKLTKLTPDTTIFFENKYSLKRRGRRPAAYYYWSAAASAAIIIAGYFILNKYKLTDVTIASVNKATDTNHAIAASATNTIAQNNTASLASTKNVVARKLRHKAEHTNNLIPIAIVNKQENTQDIKQVIKSPVQNIDTASHVTQVVTNIPKDSNTNNTFVQQRPVINNNREFVNPDKKESKSVFAFASNTIKGIGKLFKQGGVEFHKYYSKEDTSKVIAYQLTVGDNRYTVARKNSLY